MGKENFTLLPFVVFCCLTLATEVLYFLAVPILGKVRFPLIN